MQLDWTKFDFISQLITDNLEIANSWAKDTFDLKVQKLDVNDAGLFKRILVNFH
jgi:hypothetical protein